MKQANSIDINNIDIPTVMRRMIQTATKIVNYLSMQGMVTHPPTFCYFFNS